MQIAGLGTRAGLFGVRAVSTRGYSVRNRGSAHATSLLAPAGAGTGSRAARMGMALFSKAAFLDACDAAAQGPRRIGSRTLPPK